MRTQQQLRDRFNFILKRTPLCARKGRVYARPGVKGEKIVTPFLFGFEVISVEDEDTVIVCDELGRHTIVDEDAFYETHSIVQPSKQRGESIGSYLLRYGFVEYLPIGFVHAMALNSHDIQWMHESYNVDEIGLKLNKGSMLVSDHPVGDHNTLRVVDEKLFLHTYSYV